jgi:hypothetical protein
MTMDDAGGGKLFLQWLDRLAADIAAHIRDDIAAPPPPAPDETPAETADAAPGPLTVRVLVERRPDAPQAWEQIGEALQQRWQTLQELTPADHDAQLALQAFDTTPSGTQRPHQADGVVLLWGAQRDESLRTLIDRVEQQLPDACPAFVAHLSPPRPRQTQPLPADMWPGLRFEKSASSKAPQWQLVRGDVPALDRLLRQMLQHAQQRQAKARQSGPA